MLICLNKLLPRGSKTKPVTLEPKKAIYLRLKIWKNKALRSVHRESWLFLLVLCGISLGSCAPAKTLDLYYNASFLADGRIIATKEHIYGGNSGTGLGSSTGGFAIYSWVVLSINSATGDVLSEQEITSFGGQPTYVQSAIGSPKGTYIAEALGRKVDETHQDLIINIYNARTLQFEKTITAYAGWPLGLNDAPSTFICDWSPDESKLVVQINNTVSLFDFASGGKIRDLSQLKGFDCWGYGENIIGYNYETEPLMVLVDKDGATVSSINNEHSRFVTSVIQYYPTGNALLDFSAKRTVSGADLSTIETHDALNQYFSDDLGFNGNKVYVFLNPLNTRQVLYGVQSSAFDTSAHSEGIFLINLDGTNKIIVKHD